MVKKYDLSGQETHIMEMFWQNNSEMTLAEIHNILCKSGFTPTIGTLKTYLQRLVKKGALQTAKEGHKLLYSSAMSEDVYSKRWTRNFLNASFDGSLNAFISALTGNRKLTEEEVKFLKDLYDE